MYANASIARSDSAIQCRVFDVGAAVTHMDSFVQHTLLIIATDTLG